MSGADFTLTVLGTRGSMASGRAEHALFGGDSSCYMLRAGEETIFLDAGSGLLRAPAELPKPPVILLSHLHLDHIMGLGMFSGMSRPGLRIYLPFCQSPAEAAKLMERVYAPPFWPLRLPDFAGAPELLPLPERLEIGEVLAEAIPGHHPGGCMLLRLSCRGKRLVYATDYEYDAESFERLAAFARDAELLLYDGQFTPEECVSKAGFGHSSAEKGLELLEKSGARRLLLIHHDLGSGDEELLAREKRLPAQAAYARAGQRIVL